MILSNCARIFCLFFSHRILGKWRFVSSSPSSFVNAYSANDLLVKPPHLPSIPVLMEKIQDLKIVVEHMGKPPIASGIFEPWAEDLAAIAKNPTVYCKISELVTQANWENWSSEALKPYVQHAPECLGRQRLMWGSGWPVCLLATDFERTLMSSIEAHGRLAANYPYIEPEDIKAVVALRAFQ